MQLLCQCVSTTDQVLAAARGTVRMIMDQSPRNSAPQWCKEVLDGERYSLRWAIGEQMSQLGARGTLSHLYMASLYALTFPPPASTSCLTLPCHLAPFR